MQLRVSNLKLFKTISVVAALFLPLLALAQTPGAVTAFVDTVIEFINDALIPFIFALGLLAFIWGVFKHFILGGANSDSVAAGRSLVMYAVVGFVMMITIFSFVNLFAEGMLSALDQPASMMDLPSATPIR